MKWLKPIIAPTEKIQSLKNSTKYGSVLKNGHFGVNIPIINKNYTGKIYSVKLTKKLFPKKLVKISLFYRKNL